ncbi:MAG TPA: DNA polymerase III subunit gamma/tau [Thermoanaerobaculia bacterium]|nr:DNA polymerase III subunit gamma/tau [Thermoanaerobaculia bacterium]
MAYQVLARKWRPQNFSSLVGQAPIVTALRNALAERKIAQAYLFSGIRGVGKTTAARVLAKALNCEHGPAADPCNACTPCIEITRGSDLDVIEVDAATYSKVEQVRELTESLRYGPARDRYKVVVLDEIHRLSRQAFDALLKIVEEPPPHLVFIFATTEIETVPATILSRCQEFHFRRVPSPAVSALLREICDTESIQASDNALRLLARAGEGSVRDAVALLDQLATFGSGTIGDEAAVRLLGGLDTDLFRRLLQAIVAGDAALVSRSARYVEDEGWDPRQVYGQFLAFCRDALHLALGGDPSQVDLPLEEAQALAVIARASGYENLLRLLNQLLVSEQVVRRSEAGALAVEIAWLRAAELPKLTRIEELLAGGRLAPAAAEPAPASAKDQLPKPRQDVAAPAARAAAGAPPPAATLKAPNAPPPAAAAPAASALAPTPAAAAAPASSGTATGEPGQGRDLIRSFLDEISRRRQPLAAHLEQAAELRFAGGRLLVVLPRGDVFLSGRLRQPANRQAVDEAVAAVWGPGAHWESIEDTGEDDLKGEPADPQGVPSGEGRPSTPHGLRPAAVEATAAGRRPPADPSLPPPAKPGSAAPSVISNPTVQTILDIFGGKVEAVQEHASPRED